MNIFEAAKEAFPKGMGIKQECFPEAMIIDDPERAYCGVLSDDGVLYEGWNPTVEELMADDWFVTERTEIRRTERPQDRI